MSKTLKEIWMDWQKETGLNWTYERFITDWMFSNRYPEADKRR